MTISFTVDGKPVTQGSMRAAIGAGGRVAVFHDRAPALSVWRHWISAAAVGAMDGAQPLAGPVSVTLLFLLPRPGLHRNRKGELLPRFAGAKPDRAPDIDKLTRAALDAMAGICFFDDGQVCTLAVMKAYAAGQGGMTALVDTL